MWERADMRACACAAFYRCTRSGSSRPRCWTRCARRRRRPRRRRVRMRIFVSFVLSPGIFPFLDFRSDYEFVGAGDFLSILSEIERNYLYVRACIAVPVLDCCSRSGSGSVYGYVCADARRATQVGRRQGRDNGRHRHASHGELKTTTLTTITSFTTTITILPQLLQPPPLPQDQPPPLLLLQSAAPRGTRDTGHGTWHGAAGSVYTSAPSDVPASARVFAFVFAVPFVFALFLHATRDM